MKSGIRKEPLAMFSNVCLIYVLIWIRRIIQKYEKVNMNVAAISLISQTDL